jgi:hypothetical protein
MRTGPSSDTYFTLPETHLQLKIPRKLYTRNNADLSFIQALSPLYRLRKQEAANLENPRSTHLPLLDFRCNEYYQQDAHMY